MAYRWAVLVADIHHVSINVTDTARALGFYRDALGMAVLPRPEISVVGLEAGRWHVTGGPLDIAKDEVIQTLDEVIEVDGTSTYER